MQMEKEQYKKYASKRAPSSPCFANCIKAFFTGGAVCITGQALGDLYRALGISEDGVKTLIPCSLILIAMVLTGLGIFDKLAAFGGAGLLVPITGFANAVVSPAIDTTNEGYISGVGTKIFSIAGPVILFGTLASTVWGVIYFIIRTVT